MKPALLFLLISTFSFGQLTAIPDVNFELVLIDLGFDTAPTDGFVNTSAIDTISWLTVGNENISSLMGIEDFVSLEVLACGENLLTSLDVTNCPNLKILNCEENNISSLNLSNNPNLEILICGNNNLSNLDLFNNNIIQTIDCSFNNISVLDLSSNPLVTQLACSDNNLTTLDVSNHSNATALACFNNNLNCLNVKNGNNSNYQIFMAFGNPNLGCIEVDDFQWSTSNWTSGGMNIDPQMYFSTNCNNGCSVGISELSNNQKTAVKITNLLGQDTMYQSNTLLIIQYSDGTSEKVFNLEQ